MKSKKIFMYLILTIQLFTLSGCTNEKNVLIGHWVASTYDPHMEYIFREFDVTIPPPFSFQDTTTYDIEKYTVNGNRITVIYRGYEGRQVKEEFDVINNDKISHVGGGEFRRQ